MGKNKTIYLRTGIAEQLEGVDAGPLINDLLDEHFRKIAKKVNARREEFATVGIRTTVERGEIEETPTGFKQTVKVVPNQGDVDRFKKNVADTLAGVPDEEDASNEDLEKPCCANKAPCQHWQWDGDNAVWRNSLSNRERQP